MAKDDLNTALNLLEELVRFTNVPEVQNVMDGAFDPSTSVASAERLLDRHRPGWREQAVVQQA